MNTYEYFHGYFQKYKRYYNRGIYCELIQDVADEFVNLIVRGIVYRHPCFSQETIINPFALGIGDTTTRERLSFINTARIKKRLYSYEGIQLLISEAKSMSYYVVKTDQDYLAINFYNAVVLGFVFEKSNRYTTNATDLLETLIFTLCNIILNIIDAVLSKKHLDYIIKTPDYETTELYTQLQEYFYQICLDRVYMMVQ
jgi:hypothetical protein